MAENVASGHDNIRTKQEHCHTPDCTSAGLYCFLENTVHNGAKAMSHKRKPTVGYIRTSSAANVGEDKDSDRRQRLAIEGFAKRAGYDVVDWFAVVLGLAAFVAMIKWKVDIIPVVLGAGLLGLIFKTLF